MSFDDLKIPLLASSILFFLIALYLHILRRWKARSKTLKYPHLFSLEERKVNGTIQIKFELHAKDNVRVNILDHLENEIEILVSDQLDKGIHKVSFDTSMLNPGKYFYQLKSTRQNTIKRFEKV